MKILQLVTKRQYRGAEVFAANLSRELIKLGHEILFVGLYKNEKDILTVPKAENIDLIDQKDGHLSINLVKELVKVVKRTKPDVIQCNGSDTLKYMVAASFFLPKIPITYRNISMISEWVSNYPKRIIYKKLFKRIAHVSSVGEEAIEDFVKTFDYPKRKTSVIRRGISFTELDIEEERRKLREELGFNELDKIAIHIGNFSPEKNHLFLLEIFAELKETHPNIKLVCVGAGELYEEIDAEIRSRKLQDTVFLMGFRSDISELLAGSDCFVLSSKVEGVPGVILEAATQKIPAVATNVGGVSEVLIDGETGFLINNFDRKKFREKLLYVLSDDENRLRLGENAYDLVLKEFDPVKNALKFESLYDSIRNQGKKESLKILQLIQKKQYRGAEVFCCQISNHLLQQGQDVEVVSVFEGEAELPFDKEITSLNGSPTHRYWDLRSWRSLSRYIRDFEPDIVQANAADTLKYTVFSKLIYGWSQPIVYRNASTTSFYITNRYSKRINEFLLRKVDLIVSVSHASKTDLNKLYPFTRSKSSVIPVGIQGEGSSEKKKLPATYRNIIHVGSFTKEKNHFGLLNIFEKIVKQNPNVKLHLVGEGPLKVKVKNLVKERSLSDKVKFWGAISNPLDLIKSADILVLPSIIEGLPGVILEAMISKTPVIAYNVGGVSEVLNERTGYLIPKGEETIFAETVLGVLENEDQKLLENAHEFVASQFQNSELSEMFLSTYRQLLDNGVQ